MGSHEVLIRCPVTKKELSTGIALDREGFVVAELHNRTSFCHHCGRHHEWSKRDAYLRE